MVSEENIEVLIKEETSKRLAEMQEESYEFPQKIGRADVIGIVAGCAVSIILIVLCMLGVIR